MSKVKEILKGMIKELRGKISYKRIESKKWITSVNNIKRDNKCGYHNKK